MSQSIIQGKTLTETIVLDAEVWAQPAVGLFQPVFLLCEADYLHIKNAKPMTLNWAHGLLLASVGLGLSIIGKLLAIPWGHTVTVYIAEWIGLGVGFFSSLILYIISPVLPNERKRVLKQIEKFFADSPRTHHIVGQKK